jgi:5-methylcytosine-specific restriction endonuclease McrA
LDVRTSTTSPAGQGPAPQARPTARPTKTSIPKKVRELVWKRHAGLNGSLPCMCCKTQTITPFNFVAGHVQAAHLGGSMAVDNLRPICSLCNTSMGTTNMDAFILRHRL